MYHVEQRPAGANRPDKDFCVSDVPVPCRCCGGETDVVWQKPIFAGRSGYWLITCKADADDCALSGMTFDVPHYAMIDLTEYETSEREGWAMPELDAPEV